MNQISASQWSPMVSGPEEEFVNFLEFEDLQLNFQFEGAPQDGRELQPEADGGMDTSMGSGGAEVMRLENGQVQQQMDHCSPMPVMNGYHGAPDSFHHINYPGELFNQHHPPHLQMQYRGQNIVPPTPNSIEMHAEQPHYYRPSREDHRHVMYDHAGRNQKDQMIFTPLISPAVTPLDTQFQYPEYPVPGEYFSPLTSPALEAQKHANHRSVYETIQRSDTSDTTSPVDMNVDFSAPVATSTPAVRKSKRKTASTSKSANRTVRQSPSMKPQSRKTKSASAIIPPKEISGVIEGAQVAKRLARTNSAKGGKLGLPYTQDSSEAGSISPEPLSEILMPPPATPRSSSSSASPYLIAKQSGALTAPVVALSGEPATPASLMKIRKEAAQEVNGHGLPANVREKGSSKEKETQEAMNNVIFPESASAPTKPVLAPLNTSGTNDEQTTPTVSARKDLKPAPLSAPATATKPTFLASPQIYGMTSPVSSVSAKRTDTKGVGRDSRKRNSNSSVHVSPALRPKMSPSIKPLLPEGAIVNAETSALLLASKSNYQNILEGTHLPGVSYPEALSTNLTSKRTSHKIAEQGRRNRINTALQEIASLLPPPKPASHGTMGPQSNENGPDNGTSATPHHIMSGTAAQQSNSKASTVEMAIEYIKSLQSELHDVKGKLDCAEKKLASTGVGVEP